VVDQRSFNEHALDKMVLTRIKNSVHSRTPADILLLALVVVFPIYNKLMPLLIGLLVLTLFWQRREKVKISSLFSINSSGFWFVVFYATHIVGLIYTENWSYASKDLTMKLSFLLLPLVMHFTNITINRKELLRSFLVGLTLACLVAFSYATYKSLINREDNHWAYFTESYFSYSMHRSYFATYLAAGSFIAMRIFFKRPAVLSLSIFFLLTCSTVLTFSKAGILLLVLFLMLLALFELSRRVSWKAGVAAGTAILMIFLVTVFSISTLRVRFEKMISASTNVKTTNNISTESSNARVIMWATSWKLVLESPFFGVGTGDVSDALDKKNSELGNTGVAGKSLNSHNQFLNTAVQLGVFGLIPLLMLFLTSMRKAIRMFDVNFLMISILLASTMLFESFLETQAGIIPVTLLLLMFNQTAVAQKKNSSI
jgi:O-antigen ligase